MRRGRPPLSTHNARVSTRTRIIRPYRALTPDENRIRSRSSSCESSNMDVIRKEHTIKKRRRGKDYQSVITDVKRDKELPWPDISDNFKRLQVKEFPNASQADFKEWQDKVKACYRETKNSDAVRFVKAKAQREFAEHRKNLTPHKFEIKNRRLFDSFKFGLEKTNIESSPKLPPSKFWVHTEKNFATSDCLRLSHIPLVSSYKTCEQEFIQKLWDTFIEGIHGADNGCGERISEYETYRLFQTFLKKPYSKSEAEKHAFTLAFFTSFPNKYQYRQLRDENFYKHLCQRFDPRCVISHPQTFDEKCAALISNFCVQCGTVNCSFHSVHFTEHTLNKKIMDTKHLGVAEFVFNDTPCSSKCGKLKITHKMDLENRVIFGSNALESMFKSRLTSGFNMCEITEEMNALCNAAGEEEKSCLEYTMFALVERGFPVPKKKGLSSKRFKEFKLKDKNKISSGEPCPPCDHEGPCDSAKANCHCFLTNSACTLNCGCENTCKAVFPGCRCAPGLCRSNNCPCFLAGWECNPQTCNNCNSEVIKLDVDDPCCSNVALQHGWKKAMSVGLSTVKNAGYGLYIQQHVEKDELISEYTGETITDAECDRRGTVYDEMRLSYTFSLITGHYAVDAFRLGNLIRYANHKFTRENPNCRARIVKVNGEQRIGIYASRALKPGEELFFDYLYDEDHHAHLMGSKNPTKAAKKKINAPSCN